MFFYESEAIARKHQDLARLIEQVDSRIAKIGSAAPLRPNDFASALGADGNQVASVFELLEKDGVLTTAEMVECGRCERLMAASDFHQAISDEDDFDCTGCGHRIHPKTRPIVVFRLTSESVERTKADAKLQAEKRNTAEAGHSDGDPLGERAQDVLVAMLRLKALDSDSRQSTEAIATEAFGKGYDANSLKNVMTELNNRGLIDSKMGRNGGCWLQKRGLARANKLSGGGNS
jgi:DNA-directed RNA polymerase subunit RPC12/RpoP